VRILRFPGFATIALARGLNRATITFRPSSLARGDPSVKGLSDKDGVNSKSSVPRVSVFLVNSISGLTIYRRRLTGRLRSTFALNSSTRNINFTPRSEKKTFAASPRTINQRSFLAALRKRPLTRPPVTPDYFFTRCRNISCSRGDNLSAFGYRRYQINHD
jgi:hypothetical protein